MVISMQQFSTFQVIRSHSRDFLEIFLEEYKNSKTRIL